MTFDRDSAETKKFFSCFGHWSLSLQSLSFPCESNLHSAHKHLTFATLNNTENERPKTVKCKNREMKKEKKENFYWTIKFHYEGKIERPQTVTILKTVFRVTRITHKHTLCLKLDSLFLLSVALLCNEVTQCYSLAFHPNVQTTRLIQSDAEF